MIGMAYGQGSGPIWLENVQCVGNETSIANCTHNGWGVHDCSDSYGVSVWCGASPQYYGNLLLSVPFISCERYADIYDVPVAQHQSSLHALKTTVKLSLLLLVPSLLPKQTNVLDQLELPWGEWGLYPPSFTLLQLYLRFHSRRFHYTRFPSHMGVYAPFPLPAVSLLGRLHAVSITRAYIPLKGFTRRSCSLSDLITK